MALHSFHFFIYGIFLKTFFKRSMFTFSIDFAGTWWFVKAQMLNFFFISIVIFHPSIGRYSIRLILTTIQNRNRLLVNCLLSVWKVHFHVHTMRTCDLWQPGCIWLRFKLNLFIDCYFFETKRNLRVIPMKLRSIIVYAVNEMHEISLKTANHYVKSIIII